ncbi:LytR family transcriptional attenuator [Stackebrandtia endophytica]|uniref:LytR family transcriptional attenuator n=1 Tax=Stackebrandtia endophytica TaxID=1496996 RepID=A0A543AZX5_9ACTN|nr:LCP family protein [Stackebrandtia endophytica]TQL78137.1 LytR family transcriptional attenuator [Stackebrandtia endophytica]
MGQRGSHRAIIRRSPWWAKLLVGFGAILLVASVTTAGYAKMMLDKVDNAVATEDLLGNGDDGESDLVGPLNILVIGSDMREDWAAAQSDSIMIVHVNATLDKASVISIPRDLYVPIIGTDCGGVPCYDKINSAFSLGGTDPAASVQGIASSLTNLTGVQFTNAAMLDFGGFTNLVKMFGSIELCLPFDMVLAHPKGTFVEKGCKDYDEKLALGILRERYAYGPETPGWTEEWGISDYGRQQMQQHFIKQLLKKAKQEGYITDPTKVGDLIEEIGDKMLLDLGGRSVSDFVFGLRNIDPSSLETLRVPSEPAEIEGTSYVVMQPGEQEMAAQALFEALRNDTLDDWIAAHPDWVNKKT